MIVTTETCYICGAKSEFHIVNDAKQLDQAQCANCGATVQDSDVAKIIVRKLLKKDKALPRCISELANFHILKVGANGSLHESLKGLPFYVCFDWSHKVKPGSFVDGILNENIERLSFENDRFDVVISQNLMDFVRRPRKALCEINRVLKDYGHHFFTAFYNPLNATRTRLFRKPAYCEVNGKKCLVRTDWGYDTQLIMNAYGVLTDRIDAHVFYQDKEVGCHCKTAKESSLTSRCYNSVIFAAQKIEALGILKAGVGSISRKPILLLEAGPRKIEAGIGFNVQPDGQSAIWAVGANMPEGACLVMNDVELESVLMPNGTLLTARVPQHYFSHPGTLRIKIFEPRSNRSSNELLVEVVTGEDYGKVDFVGEA